MPAETPSEWPKSEGTSSGSDGPKMAMDFRKKIYGQMLATRGPKFRSFLYVLRGIKYVSGQTKRAELLESLYAFMRYIDDIVDGDTTLPEGYENAIAYVQRKIDFAGNPNEPKDEAEQLLLYCLELSKNLGEDIGSEIQDILGSLRFDAQRRNPTELQLLPQKELEMHFHLLDIRGTISACLKIANEKNVHYEDLAPLGEASRIFYTLRDYNEDLQAGYCNVSTEAMEEHNIPVDEIRNDSHPGVKQWFIAEAQKGLSYIQQYRQRLPSLQLRRLTKTALWWIYERPAKKFFESILRPKS